MSQRTVLGANTLFIARSLFLGTLAIYLLSSHEGPTKIHVHRVNNPI